LSINPARRDEQQHEQGRAEVCGGREAVVDRRAAEDCRESKHRQRCGRPELERRGRTERGDGIARVGAGVVEHRSGERGGGGAAAREDAPGEVPGQLRRRDRKPAPRAERDPIELPEADVARDFAGDDEDGERPVEVRERPPRPEHGEQAREQEVERGPGQHEQDAPLSVAHQRSR
jgi:hypothetical protein